MDSRTKVKSNGMNKRQIFIDTETTGLSPNNGHRIVEIAAIETVSGQITGKVFHTYLDPEREIDPGAMKVHGLTLTFLEGKPTFFNIAETFVNFIRDAELIMHNAQFDTSFINAEFKRAGFSFTLNDIGNVQCTMKLARSLFPGESVSLDSLVQRSNIKIVRGKHSALEDARILSDVFFRVLSSESFSTIDDQNRKCAKIQEGVRINQALSSDLISPEMLGMEKVIELVNARKETFFIGRCISASLIIA